MRAAAHARLRVVCARVAACCAFAAFAPQRGAAQCTSNASSCVTCHEGQAARPVLQDARPWHADHAFGDLCVACHAGDPAAAEADAAHRGLRPVLANAELACQGCHPRDFERLVPRYLTALAGPTPSGAATTPVHPPRNDVPAIAAPRAPSTGRAGTTANALLAGLAVVLGGLLYRGIRRLPVALQPRRRGIGVFVRAKGWSPSLAGAGLGLLVAASQLFWRRPLAAAGAFDKLAAYGGRWLFPDSQYYVYVMTPGVTWQVWLMLGVLLGSCASSALAGELRWRWLPDSQWVPRFGHSRLQRIAIAFVGAVLVQIGAGIAGGCTSGLAISGGVLMAPAAFLFMAGMFAAGIPTAWLAYRGSEVHDA